MTIALYLDHDSSARGVVTGRRSAGYDVLTTAEAGNERAPDYEQLSFATRASRTLYSANVGDFTRLHARWLAEGRTHAGIIVRADQLMSIGVQLQALTRICSQLDPLTALNAFEYLGDWLPPKR